MGVPLREMEEASATWGGEVVSQEDQGFPKTTCMTKGALWACYVCRMSCTWISIKGT